MRGQELYLHTIVQPKWENFIIQKKQKVLEEDDVIKTMYM